MAQSVKVAAGSKTEAMLRAYEHAYDQGLRWTPSFGQESGLVKLWSGTPFHSQAGTSSRVEFTSGWWTWSLQSSNTWAGVW